MRRVEDLAAGLAAELDHQLAAEDDALVARFPGERPGRQPVHTVYVPADRYDADLTRAWGEQARQAMTDHAGVLRECLGDSADDLLPLVDDKLGREPIEDLRIDFEDGYGTPGDEVEDADVGRAARALASSQRQARSHRRTASGSRASSGPRGAADSRPWSDSSTTCSRRGLTSSASW